MVNLCFLSFAFVVLLACFACLLPLLAFFACLLRLLSTDALFYIWGESMKGRVPRSHTGKQCWEAIKPAFACYNRLPVPRRQPTITGCLYQGELHACIHLSHSNIWGRRWCNTVYLFGVYHCCITYLYSISLSLYIYIYIFP